MSTMVSGVRWGLDRMLSVGYGTVYDFIFDHFGPYRQLQDQVLELVESTVPRQANRRDVKILEIGCGPGNFAFTLAAAGFSVVGIDTYDALVELAREKRRATHCSHLAFQHSDLAAGNTFPDGAFDQLVCIHSLYVHPDPEQLLKHAHRVLKPGGHAIVVNHTRRLPLWETLRQVWKHEGFVSALRCLLWLLPNAIFEVVRKRTGPHYWQEQDLASHLQRAGFDVIGLRRTFFNGTSLLAWARKHGEG